MTERFDDGIALERLQSFFEYCRSLGDGLGEAEVVSFLLTITAAINQEMRYDTIDEYSGRRAQEVLDEYFALSAGTINKVVEDLAREEEVRRQEVVDSLTDYQRNLLGLKRSEETEGELQ